jgi:flagellar motor switch protein FliM
MDLVGLKSHWNEVLFALEAKNRVAWLTFFDARLANFESKILLLDFSDSEKFAGGHSYSEARERFAPLLSETLFEITGEKIEVKW